MPIASSEPDLLPSPKNGALSALFIVFIFHFFICVNTSWHIKYSQ